MGRVLLAALVLLLELWALAGVTALPDRRQRVRWIALIIGVPVVGAVLWARRRGEEGVA